eukprot:Colp12_sorted_trinity150504_noHs@5363
MSSQKVDYSRKFFGVELADQVATKLIDGFELAYRHRDFCGQGLTFNPSKSAFVLVFVYDGGADEVLKTFYTRDEFVLWLSQQCDYTMSGADTDSDLYQEWEFNRGNQFISEERLRSFLESTEKSSYLH